MNTSRGFLHITYKLYHHLDIIDGVKKSYCLNVFFICYEICLEEKWI